MRLLVLTGIIVAAATAAVGAQATPLCPLDDCAPGAAACGAPDQELERRQGSVTPVVAPAAPITLPAPAAVDASAPLPLKQALVVTTVIAFAPKTSPPRARWF
ncbi:MAG TPA: hypothetical protein VFU21_19785 [Kofleriaceae bacterium]|nr:hypothetical protein [Kofleriaceae bacterium]